MRSIQRYPRYVQRATHRTPDHAPSKAKDIDRHFSWDYMGSAEFEFGTLARTMNSFMHDWMEAEKVWGPKEMKTSLVEQSFWYVGPPKHEAAFMALVEDQLTDKEWDLHERSELRDACGLSKYTCRVDSWLAIPTEISRSYTNKTKWANIKCEDRPFAFFLKEEAAKAFLKGLDERQHRWEEESET